IPMVSHGGEVSGFLAEHAIFPTRNAAIIVLSNEDGINLIGPLSQQIAALLLISGEPSPAETDQEAAQTKAILEGLQRGEVDRSLFTDNANSYFTVQSLQDFKTSLQALGPLKGVTRVGANLRGGMTHRSYRAQFEKQSLMLNIYVMPD